MPKSGRALRGGAAGGTGFVTPDMARVSGMMESAKDSTNRTIVAASDELARDGHAALSRRTASLQGRMGAAMSDVDTGVEAASEGNYARASFYLRRSYNRFSDAAEYSDQIYQRAAAAGSGSTDYLNSIYQDFTRYAAQSALLNDELSRSR